MVWVSFHVAISCIISRGSLRCYVEKDSGAEKERVGDHLAIAVMAVGGKGWWKLTRSPLAIFGLDS